MHSTILSRAGFATTQLLGKRRDSLRPISSPALLYSRLLQQQFIASHYSQGCAHAHQPGDEHVSQDSSEHTIGEHAGQDAGHGCGGIEGASHQLQHRLAEKSAFGVLEKVAERLTSKTVAEHVGAKVINKAAERVAERAAERAGEKAAAHAGLKAAEHAVEKLGEHAVENLGERLAERLGERMGERMAERVGERLTERAGERLGQRMGSKALGRAGIVATEQLAERSATAVAMHGEIATGERIIEGVSRAAESAVAAHAGSSAALHGANASERLLGNRFALLFSPKLLARIGRGAMVALPAIGAVFVAHLAHQDFERMMEERAHRNQPAFILFGIAFIFDVLDVLAHIVIVMGLTHEYFHVGLHVAHHVMHMVERSGIGIAIVSTASAAIAELMSLGGGMQHGAKLAVHKAVHGRVQHAAAVALHAKAVSSDAAGHTADDGSSGHCNGAASPQATSQAQQ